MYCRHQKGSSSWFLKTKGLLVSSDCMRRGDHRLLILHGHWPRLLLSLQRHSSLCEFPQWRSQTSQGLWKYGAFSSVTNSRHQGLRCLRSFISSSQSIDQLVVLVVWVTSLLKPLYAYLREIPSTPDILFYVCVSVCIACIHNQRRISAVFLCGSLAYYLETGISHWTRNFLFGLDWLFKKLWESVYLCCPMSRLQTNTTMPGAS